MSKFKKSVRRADGGTEDHVHRLPSGDMTQGALHKPSKDQFDMHTHLYECGEDTCETGPAHNFGDHTHDLKEGEETSGPMPVPKKPGDKWEKMDSMHREGSQWVVRSVTGQILKRSEDRKDCEDFVKEHSISNA